MIHSHERNGVKCLPSGLATAGKFIIILNVPKYTLMLASLLNPFRKNRNEGTYAHKILPHLFADIYFSSLQPLP